jgi:hypothetical protein
MTRTAIPISSLMLKRIDHRDWATYGVILGPKGPVIVTLERPFADNFGKMSYIRAGVYQAKRTYSPKLRIETFEVTGVEGRSRILFHAGNTAADSEGCILTGTTFDPIGADGKVGVTGSKVAFLELMTLLRDTKEFSLTVADF